MKPNRSPLIALSLVLLALLASSVLGWRSVLYPTDWKPGFKDSQGRMIQDFSYAGYKTQGINIPSVADADAAVVIDVTSKGADKNGNSDSTSAIQSAIDAACSTSAAAGKYRVVHMPAGTYKLSKKGNACLKVTCSNIILRGEGAEKTMLWNTDYSMRGADIISVGTGFNWPTSGGTPLTADAKIGDTSVQVSTSGLSKGDWVTVYTPMSGSLINEIGATGPLGWNKLKFGPTFARQITNVGSGSIDLDAPIRFPLKTRDRAAVVKVNGTPKSEIGLENFSIGNSMNPRTSYSPNGYKNPGDPSYSAHGSSAVGWDGVVNSWMSGVKTYKPAANSQDIHVLSNGFTFMRSARITVLDSETSKAEYRGGGGNGYGFSLQSQEVLVAFSECNAMRHCFTMSKSFASGNVFTGCKDSNPLIESDFHMHLSPSDLFDNTTLVNSGINAKFRPYGSVPIHGYTTTESVIWNTRGSRFDPKRGLVGSKQLGNGYVVGVTCTGNMCGKGVGDVDVANPTVSYGGKGYDTSPVDYTEGIDGKAETLEPQSLFFDQYKLRTGK